ncbi:hypothetical protein CAPTEDRAFT_207005 [Capitella teleta]|uniref:Uncharacterized protein n=1 Tax=Capitella teleta TaxID=283909 RepID=R7UQW6_CAPTE|nr:hypothetical protein CAPTEDRAFT_207005 [Capitella teleta]|eukprot:ELU08929.1 hypothetical protein CAPTEDRAFT_207005 [Capitella teleta]
MEVANIQLSAINGEIYAGLACGNDLSLNEGDKLPVFPKNKIAAISMASRWAFNKYGGDPATRDIAINGIRALFSLGLLEDNYPDHNYSDQSATLGAAAESDAEIIRATSKDEMRKAFTVVLATKASFWLTNHHVGHSNGEMVHLQ